MNPPTSQERHAANLAALRQSLKEMAASRKSTTPTTNERPDATQGPVVRGK
jgi:hypothetical protein